MKAAICYNQILNKWTINIYDELLRTFDMHGNEKRLIISLIKELARIFNMNQSDFLKKLAQFGGRQVIYDDRIYFDTNEEANEALKWIESLILMKQLSN
jgi:hypothetical protein